MADHLVSHYYLRRANLKFGCQQIGIHSRFTKKGYH
jgi:hypothetical protein